MLKAYIVPHPPIILPEISISQEKGLATGLGPQIGGC